MRLIDADAIIPKGTRITPDNVDLATAIRFAPTVDAVPVVKCGQCKFNNICCRNVGKDGKRTKDDFCSYGELKEDS